MNGWNERSREIAYLLNPAFCGRLLYSTISSYRTIAQHAFPFPLTYLILPLVLHKETRLSISSRKQLHVWVQQNPQLLMLFPKRAKALVQTTNEALELLLQTKAVELTTNAELDATLSPHGLSKTKYVDHEVQECLSKCEHIAKWFARAGSVENIYIELGVRP